MCDTVRPENAIVLCGVCVVEAASYSQRRVNVGADNQDFVTPAFLKALLKLTFVFGVLRFWSATVRRICTHQVD